MHPAPPAQPNVQKVDVKKAATANTPLPVAPKFTVSTLQNRKRWFKGLFYGENGVGKTELAGTCADVPDMSDVFIVSAEKGEVTLEQTDRILRKDNIFQAPCDTVAEVELMRQWLIAHCLYRDQGNVDALKNLERAVGIENDGPPKLFRTCIVDTLTEVQAFAMYKILGLSNAMKFDAEMPDREWSHFNKILANVQIMARAFRDLNMHVILLCQAQRTTDDNKKPIFGPSLEGQMAKRIMGFVDMVGYLTVVRDSETQKDIRHLIVQPGYGYQAKNRFSSYKGNSFSDPSMSKIVQAIGWGASAQPVPSLPLSEANK